MRIGVVPTVAAYIANCIARCGAFRATTAPTACAAGLAMMLCFGCPSPRSLASAGGPADFCRSLDEMLAAADRNDLCVLVGAKPAQRCFGERPPLSPGLGRGGFGATRCFIDTGIESSRYTYSCVAPVAAEAGPSALLGLAARIERCLASAEWHRNPRWHEHEITWSRAGDDLGATTEPRIVASFHGGSPGIGPEVSLGVYGVGHPGRGCERLYTLVRAADRFDGFASLRDNAFALVEQDGLGKLET